MVDIAYLGRIVECIRGCARRRFGNPAARQQAVSAQVISLEISSRNSRVAALQKRWDYLRAGLALLLQQRGADMLDVPGGSSGLLCRDFKGREGTTEVYRIDPGVVALASELRAFDTPDWPTSIR